MTTVPAIRSRATGCLLGQLAGDALGSLVEFKTPKTIRRNYPDGVRDLADGGVWDTIAGQPTDDSEMALALARHLVADGAYDPVIARRAYVAWLDSGPFDLGTTINHGLRGNGNPNSQANGAMMRVSPLGIFGANHTLKQVGTWARQDAAITHPSRICRQANALYVMAIATAVKTGVDGPVLYAMIVNWADEMSAAAALRAAIHAAEDAPPSDFMVHQGWVLLAFQNALWQLLHASSLEEGIIDTVMRGGDTDTNAAICGALLGAVHGREAVPQRWVDKLRNCRPEAGCPGVRQPRPQCFWPVDAEELAMALV